MEVNSGLTYNLKLSNHNLMIAVFIWFGVIAIALLCLFAFGIEHSNQESFMRFFFFGMLGIMIGGPLLLLIVFWSITKRVDVNVHQYGIDTNMGVSIHFDSIKWTKTPVNRHGTVSLFIIALKNGKKYSFTPVNKFDGRDITAFQMFVNEFEEMRLMTSPE